MFDLYIIPLNESGWLILIKGFEIEFWSCYENDRIRLLPLFFTLKIFFFLFVKP